MISLRIILYLLCFIGIVFVLATIGPLVAFIFRKNANQQYAYTFSFSPEVFDASCENLHFENVDDPDNQVSKFKLKDRGSVRMAQGNILGKEAFEEKKQDEYSKQLP